MGYDKESDILNMYKWKCGWDYPDGSKCPVKFMDKPSLILHLQMVHAYIAKDLRIPAQDLKVIRNIQITHKAVTTQRTIKW
jgi:hypothetical protein